MKKRYSIPIGISVAVSFLFIAGFVVFLGIGMEQGAYIEPIDLEEIERTGDYEKMFREFNNDMQTMNQAQFCAKYGHTDMAIKNGLCQ